MLVRPNSVGAIHVACPVFGLISQMAGGITTTGGPPPWGRTAAAKFAYSFPHKLNRVSLNTFCDPSGLKLKGLNGSAGMPVSPISLAVPDLGFREYRLFAKS